MPDDARFTHYDRLHAEHVVRMAAHENRMDALEALAAPPEARLTRLDDQLAQQQVIHRALVEGFDRLEAALRAIKDLLERGSARDEETPHA